MERDSGPEALVDSGFAITPMPDPRRNHPEFYADFQARLRAAKKMRGQEVEDYDPNLDGIMVEDGHDKYIYTPPATLDIQRQYDLADREYRRAMEWRAQKYRPFWRRLLGQFRHAPD
ncbi:MAG TPA: hypothetical protein VLG37_00115 [Candidatus Saccharimonadales bacterium]|nr:hypothetical protein [Candidatus Saccharimonadales bacterium]